MHCKGETYTYSSNGNIISQHHYSGDGIPRRIVPYGKDYYFANGICDFLKINRVQEESKWHWIFSNDKYSYYIDENNISYDNNRVYFFVKKETSKENFEVISYICNITEPNVIYFSHSGARELSRTIFPDSIEEVIFDYAKRYYAKKENCK